MAFVRQMNEDLFWDQTYKFLDLVQIFDTPSFEIDLTFDESEDMITIFNIACIKDKFHICCTQKEELIRVRKMLQLAKLIETQELNMIIHFKAPSLMMLDNFNVTCMKSKNIMTISVNNFASIKRTWSYDSDVDIKYIKPIIIREDLNLTIYKQIEINPLLGMLNET
jgi:hypothetical protein